MGSYSTAPPGSRVALAQLSMRMSIHVTSLGKIPGNVRFTIVVEMCVCICMCEMAPPTRGNCSRQSANLACLYMVSMLIHVTSLGKIPGNARFTWCMNGTVFWCMY